MITSRRESSLPGRSVDTGVGPKSLDHLGLASLATRSCVLLAVAVASVVPEVFIGMLGAGRAQVPYLQRSSDHSLPDQV